MLGWKGNVVCSPKHLYAIICNKYATTDLFFTMKYVCVCMLRLILIKINLYDCSDIHYSVIIFHFQNFKVKRIEISVHKKRFRERVR